MIRIFLSFSILMLSFSAFSQTKTVDITGGSFLISEAANGEQPNNATIQTDEFTATSLLGGRSSPWFDICQTDVLACSFGSTFTVPKYSLVSLGGCVGDCSQFVSGTFTINGTTYQNVFFRGYFNFSRESFFIPRITKRKGTVVFQKPFTISGQLQVCEIRDFDVPCPADRILFSGNVKGKGTLTATMQIRSASGPRPYPLPYLQQQSFEYRFE